MRIANLKVTGTTLIIAAFFLSIWIVKKTAPTPLDKSPVSNQLKHFIAEKKAQANAAAAAEGKEMLPEFKSLFVAAEKGDWDTISNIFLDLRRIQAQYSDHDGTTAPNGFSVSNVVADVRSRVSEFRGEDIKSRRLHGTQWEAVREVWGAFDCLASDVAMDKYFVALGQDIIKSIPPGSIYFGGTDPGRWTVTALQASQIKADPFFTLTQNQLSDPAYLDYLRGMYGTKIYVPNDKDLEKCFSEYMDDAQRRIFHDQQFPNKPKEIKPGEEPPKDSSDHIQIGGQVAVMAIHERVAKIIFEHETNREFYVEESFPLEWMYPHLEPHGLIMKLNREPLAEIPDAIIRQDHEFWSARISPVIGDWLKDDTSVQEICAFARKVNLKHDFNGFKGDRRFVGDDWPSWLSKLRSSIAGVYAWRTGISPIGGTVPPEYLAKAGAERQRMIREADFAYRQAFALCPASPEAVWRYINFLVNVDQRRTEDAIAIAEVGLAIHRGKPDGNQFQYLLDNLRKIRNQQTNSPPAH
jgi:hypothetical protein